MIEKQEAEVGRVMKKAVWSAADAKMVIAAWRESGQSRAAFARGYGESERRMCWWLGRLEESRASKRTKKVRFHRVRVASTAAEPVQSGAEARIEIRLREGCSLHLPHGFSPDDLRKVLEVLAVRA